MLLDVNHEVAGISDAAGLEAEVVALRDSATVVTQHLELERNLAKSIHHARQVTVAGSPALSLVFESALDGEHVDRSKRDVDSMLSSAFATAVVSDKLPEGLATVVDKDLRTAVHTDIGGDTKTAQAVGESLDKKVVDESFAVAKAMLATPVKKGDAQGLRDERHRLHLVLGGLSPHFESEDDAKAHAEAEIESTPWRVRTQAAFESLLLITGDDDTWIRFMEGVVREENMVLINLVNRVHPEILAINERIIKGDPKNLSAKDLQAVDDIFEKIWSTLDKNNKAVPYHPPYQNWLDILLEALRILDPGQKPGNQYTRFEPPIKVTYASNYNPDYTDYGRKSNMNYINTENYSDNYRNNHYNKKY